MSGHRRTWSKAAAVLGEAFAITRSQRVAAVVTIVLIAAATATVIVATAETIQAEQRVLDRIGDEDLLSLDVIDRDGGANLTADAVDRIARLSGVRWTVGFSSAQDVWNPALGRDAARVPWRRLYGDLEQLLGPSMVAHVRPSSNLPQLALGDGATVAALGLRDGVGAAASGDGTQVTVVGASLDLPPGLAELSGTLLSPGGPGSESLRSIHVVLEDHRWISEVESGIGFVLGATQAESVDVRSSRELVELRAAIAGDFGAFGRRLTAIILLAAACLVALNVYMAVTGRRRDFGRRRALGASRPMLIALVSLGTGLLALAGAVSGLLVGAWWSWWTSGVWPSPSFVGAVGVLAVVVAVAASLPPAAVAAFRDPVRALRVP